MSRQQIIPSPPWHRALERYRDELEDTEDYKAIQETRSLQGLAKSLESIPAFASRDVQLGISLNKLAPKLKFVDDFSAVLALCFGADASLMAAVWGSIRLILVHASSDADNFQDVINMLEELSLAFPQLQVNKDTLPLTSSFESALVDVYYEAISFYARTIHFFRHNPHAILRQSAWKAFRNDFSRTIMRVKRVSSVVEKETEVARMRKDDVKYNGILDILNAITIGKTGNGDNKLPYNNIPFAMNSRFSGRGDALSVVHELLDPEGTASSFESFALFGMGGVGKTQIGIQYAYQSLDQFDVVLWIAADNAISISESFGVVADGLGLSGEGDETKETTAAVWKVKNWLNSTKSTWLVIFDNADDLTALRTAWPGTIHGSVLVTTRDFTVATSLPAQYLQVDTLTDEDGSKMLLKATGMEQASSSDQEDALTISKTLGGLPLALTQIGAFIRQRKLRLRDFLPLYERNCAKIDARKAAGEDYEYTLGTVWNVSFEKLTDNSTRLLNVLGFLEPDNVAEDIFLNGFQDSDDFFSFLSDEMDLGDASEELLRAALVNRAAEDSALSIHRLVQSAVLRRIDDSEKTNYFDAIVQMLCWGFPDHGSKDIGHQIASWAQCEKYLAHLNHLLEVSKRPGMRPGDQQKYAELLMRCGWYLYEREMYTIAREMVQQAIATFEDKTTLPYASAIDLGGLIDLDMNEAARALEPFNRALEIRASRLGAEDPFVAYSLNNIALAYTEMGEPGLAYLKHQEAIKLRLKANSDRIGNSYSNLSSLLLRMGKPDDAEEMIARCPSLKDFTDETFIRTGNPRFSGDMVLLSRIRLAQGRTNDALRLASKALAFRRDLLGNRLKTCDSLYDVASMLLQSGHVGSAMQFLEELVSISETFVEGQGQRARAMYKLSELYADKGMATQSQVCKDEALELRKTLKPELSDAPFQQAEFSKLCIWMLW